MPPSFQNASRILVQGSGLFQSRATVLASSGRDREAIKAYTKLIASGCDNLADVYCSRGDCFRRVKAHDEAIEDYTLAIKVDATNIPAYRKRGLLLSDTERYERALDDFDALIRMSPRDSESFASRGLCHATLGHFDKSVEDYASAIAIAPDADLVAKRGAALCEMGRLDEALEDLDHALDLAPACALAHYHRGRVLTEKGDLADAIESFTNAQQDSDGKAMAYLGRGIALLLSEQNDAAIEDFSTSIEIDPTLGGYVNRGIAFQGKHDYAAAINDYSQALQLDSTQPVIYENRAGAWEDLAEYSNAVCDYEQWLQLSPRDPGAYVGFATFLLTCADPELRHYGRAKTLAQKGCELTKWTSREPISVFARACSMLDDFASAVMAQEKAVNCAETELCRKQSLVLLDGYRSGRTFDEIHHPESHEPKDLENSVRDSNHLQYSSSEDLVPTKPALKELESDNPPFGQLDSDQDRMMVYADDNIAIKLDDSVSDEEALIVGEILKEGGDIRKSKARFSDNRAKLTHGTVQILLTITRVTAEKRDLQQADAYSHLTMHVAQLLDDPTLIQNALSSRISVLLRQDRYDETIDCMKQIEDLARPDLPEDWIQQREFVEWVARTSRPSATPCDICGRHGAIQQGRGVIMSYKPHTFAKTKPCNRCRIIVCYGCAKWYSESELRTRMGKAQDDSSTVDALDALQVGFCPLCGKQLGYAHDEYDYLPELRVNFGTRQKTISHYIRTALGLRLIGFFVIHLLQTCTSIPIAHHSDKHLTILNHLLDSRTVCDRIGRIKHHLLDLNRQFINFVRFVELRWNPNDLLTKGELQRLVLTIETVCERRKAEASITVKPDNSSLITTQMP